MIIPKWFNKWLTPEEEQQLRDPSRRVFTFGLLASVVSLALPSSQLSDLEAIRVRAKGIAFSVYTTPPDPWLIDSFDPVFFDDVLRTFPLTSKDYPCISR